MQSSGTFGCHFFTGLTKKLKQCIIRNMKKIKNKTKKFKTDEPEIPFTFDFYLIYWEDIQSDSGWRDLKDIQDSKPAICVSTGWLVKKDAKVHIVMSDYNYNDKGEMGEGGNTTVIPTKNVITKYKIADL